MSQQEMSKLALREEFVRLASQPEVNRRQLCRRYGISPKTGYTWLRRFQAGGVAALAERPRRPQRSPQRPEPAMEAAIVAVRDAHPAWGGRKIRAYLQGRAAAALPSAGTITAILRRHQRLEPSESPKHRRWQRFEAEAPNRLGQMDFKGHFALATGRCHPLTVLDDHSRFVVCLSACADETTETVQAALTDTFRRYGLPERMTMDHGSPWGADQDHALTPLTLWLIRLGIRPSHSRPYHPQTQGKDERFHRTLKAEVLRDRCFATLHDCQLAFDQGREMYNLQRPHEALAMAVPVSRYRPSPRSFPERLEPIEYAPDDHVRQVQAHGEICFQGRTLRVAKALQGYPVALRPTTTNGQFEVYFCHRKVAHLDLHHLS
jgi:transposase InsO family protein